MRALWRLIARILSHVWRGLNFIRVLILNLMVMLIVVFCFALIWIYNKSSVPANTDLNKPTVLKVDLKGMLVDKPVSGMNLVSELQNRLLKSGNSSAIENSIFQLADTLNNATYDKNINSIVLDLNQFVGADQTSLKYIGKRLSAFRQHGKMIYAYSENYSQSQYYLASFANKIYLGYQGSIDLHGFASNHLYFKNLLDKAGVNAHIFRVGTYKSAVEPYLRNDMSAEARQADSRWINQLWDSYLQTVANNRNLTPEQLFPASDVIVKNLTALQGDSAAYAVKYKLVDQLISRTEFEKIMAEKVGSDAETHSYRAISIYDYHDSDYPRKGNIAVIIANGVIIDGQGRDSETGSDTLTDQINQATHDDKIKGIILRVNSPGGSITASEQIRESVSAARTAGKPVVVSMGGMAASGGYWISTPANWIVASPTTLTGSIGIFGIINTVENLLGKVGVNTDGVATSPFADISTTKVLPEPAVRLIQLSVQHGYQRFISLVAKSRHKTFQQIDAIAQGHVWTGFDAKNIGLVDQLGDFDDAVNKMQLLAHIQKPQLVFYNKTPTLLGSVIEQINSASMLHLQNLLPAPIKMTLQSLALQPSLSTSRLSAQNIYAICQDCSLR